MKIAHSIAKIILITRWKTRLTMKKIIMRIKIIKPMNRIWNKKRNIKMRMRIEIIKIMILASKIMIWKIMVIKTTISTQIKTKSEIPQNISNQEL